ncbi:MAG: hypothetical protein V1916_00685 [Patescibacteria group bacterium]
MGLSIIYFLLIVLCVAGLVCWIIKSPVARRQKVIMSIVSLFAVVGLSVVLLAVYAAVDGVDFKPKLGHYIISKFSQDNDIIGRLTLTDKNHDGQYEVFPGNKNEKLMAVYDGPNLITAWLKTDSSGSIYLEKVGDPMPITLRYFFFPQKALSL